MFYKKENYMNILIEASIFLIQHFISEQNKHMNMIRAYITKRLIELSGDAIVLNAGP